MLVLLIAALVVGSIFYLVRIHAQWNAPPYPVSALLIDLSYAFILAVSAATLWAQALDSCAL